MTSVTLTQGISYSGVLGKGIAFLIQKAMEKVVILFFLLYNNANLHLEVSESCANLVTEFSFDAIIRNKIFPLSENAAPHIMK